MIEDFLDSKGKWKCIGCGDCCRMIQDILPDFDRGDGVCKHFVEEHNHCSIYEDRPYVCTASNFPLSAKVAAAMCDRIRIKYAKRPRG